MTSRLIPLLCCVAVGCVPSSSSTSPDAASTDASSTAGEAGAGAGAGAAPDQFIASYRPSATWSALTRETMPHGWPQDVELRPPRAVEYDPRTGVLQIGRDDEVETKTLSTTRSESVHVVWIPDYVTASECPGTTTSGSLVLAVARESIRELTVTGDGVESTREAPKVVFGAVPVQVRCSELSDPRWVAEHSAQWRPTDEQKRARRVLGKGEPHDGGVIPRRVVSSEARLGQVSPAGVPGAEDVDFQTHSLVALGDGASRLQYVHPEAIETQSVAVVDVRLTTTACRQRQTEGLSKLVFLADDTGPEPGRYRVEGSPLFVRQVQEPRHELRFEKCSSVFPLWQPLMTFVQPNPSMYLRLYGRTPRKERAYEDQIVAAMSVTEVGDTHNLAIPLLTPITCPPPGPTKAATTKARSEAHLVRRAVLRRRFSMPHHDGPVRLVTTEQSPYDAVEWNLDAKPCTAPPER